MSAELRPTRSIAAATRPDLQGLFWCGFCAVLSGVTLGLALPPGRYPGLAWLAILPLLQSLYYAREHTGLRLACGALCGLVYATVTSVEFEVATGLGGAATASAGVAWPGAAMMTMASLAGFALFCGPFLRSDRASVVVPGIAITWLAMELMVAALGWELRVWLSLGLSLDPASWLARDVSVIGIHGVSVLLGLTNAAALWFFNATPRRRGWLPLAVVAALVLGAFTLPSIDRSRSERAASSDVPIGLITLPEGDPAAGLQLSRELLPPEGDFTETRRSPRTLLWFGAQRLPGPEDLRSPRGEPRPLRAAAGGQDIERWHLVPAPAREGQAMRLGRLVERNAGTAIEPALPLPVTIELRGAGEQPGEEALLAIGDLSLAEQRWRLAAAASAGARVIVASAEPGPRRPASPEVRALRLYRLHAASVGRPLLIGARSGSVYLIEPSGQVHRLARPDVESAQWIDVPVPASSSGSGFRWFVATPLGGAILAAVAALVLALLEWRRGKTRNRASPV